MDTRGATPPDPRAADLQFGCVAKRRREEAIMVQQVHGWELSVARYSHVSTFYDAANAFWSLSQDKVVDAAAPAYT